MTKHRKNKEANKILVPKSIDWARVGGQSQSIRAENYIAVDGIENVMNVLEEMELGKLSNIDFFEGLACVGGCVGGPLNVENPFIAKNRIRRMAENDDDYLKLNKVNEDRPIDDASLYLTEEIKPKGIMKLDSNIEEAMEKMHRIDEIYGQLLGLDCGSCGAPTCYALAEDIVKQKAAIKDCVFTTMKD